MKLLFILSLVALSLAATLQDGATPLGTMLRTFECGNVTSQFYAKVDGILSNFGNVNNSQQIAQLLTLGNQYLTSNVVVTIDLPTGGSATAVGITQFAYLVGQIALVDCGEHHVFGPYVPYQDVFLDNNITIWFNEVSYANASPTGFCAGATNGTASIIPGRFEVTCSRASWGSQWFISKITQAFRGTAVTGLSWNPGWLAVYLPDNTYP